MNCLFCKLKDDTSIKIYENDRLYVIKDINPQAVHHYLIISKQHIENAANINDENAAIFSDVFVVCKKIAEMKKIDSYRIITNCGENAGQTVLHLHFHMISGEKLGKMC